jgi:hypothetical protein
MIDLLGEWSMVNGETTAYRYEWERQRGNKATRQRGNKATRHKGIKEIAGFSPLAFSFRLAAQGLYLLVACSLRL